MQVYEAIVRSFYPKDLNKLHEDLNMRSSCENIAQRPFFEVFTRIDYLKDLNANLVLCEVDASH